MQLKKLSALVGLVVLTAPMFASLANAGTVSFTTYKDAKGAVYYSGTANSEVNVTIGGLPKTKNLKSNACGLSIVKNSLTSPLPASFTIGANTVTVASLSTQILPKCSTAGVLEEARTANFKTAAGDVVIVGQTPNASIAMTYLSSSLKKVKMNSCGFGKISNSTTKPFGADMTFMDGSNTLTYSSISTKPAHICGKDGTVYAPILSGS